MTDKLFINSNQFADLSTKLASKICESDTNYDFIIGVSRGGCIPSIIIHEFLSYKGHQCSYGIISAKSYNNDNEREFNTEIDISETLLNKLKHSNKILIVDDVLDSGYTLMDIGNFLCTHNIFSDKFDFATVYYKPDNNKSTIIPKYYVEISNEWIVFPHELVGLKDDEIKSKLNN